MTHPFAPQPPPNSPPPQATHPGYDQPGHVQSGSSGPQQPPQQPVGPYGAGAAGVSPPQQPRPQPVGPYGDSPTAPPPFLPKQLRGRGLTAAIAVGVLVAVAAVGIGGVFVGSRLNGDATSQPTQSSPPPPSAEEVDAATVDLCTRFAAAYRAMPAPQSTGFDIIPTLNYISDALRDNVIADQRIREAIEVSLRLGRDQASKFSKEGARGAIQPANEWTPESANAADQRVWDLCRAYGA